MPDRKQQEAEWQRAPVHCLLTTLTPARGLSRALVEHLSEEFRPIRFHLQLPQGCDEPDAVWVCGYRRGHALLVRQLRKRFEHAALIVTGRSPLDPWEAEVKRAGADSACTWPLPYPKLRALLSRGRTVRVR